MSTAEERMQDRNPVGIALQNYIEELEQENRLLRARNTRLEAEANAAPVQPVATCKQHLQVEQLFNDMLDTLPYNSPEYWIGRIKEVLPLYTTPPAAPVQPVAEYRGVTNDGHHIIKAMQPLKVGALFYTAPPAAQRQWVDLTDRQIESIFLDAGWSWGEKADMYVPAVREVLKLFKETNE